MSTELIVSRENGPYVALGMTSASFDSAQRAGIVRIEADTDAMGYIARQVGLEALSPQVIVTRDSGEARSTIGRWDDRLPVHQGNPNSGRYFPANHLERQTPASANRELFVEAARRIGATSLTEVSISGWQDETRHAAAFAEGLLLGQRPLDLPPKPSLLGSIGNIFADESYLRAAVKTVADDKTMPRPFIITRQLGLELG